MQFKVSRNASLCRTLSGFMMMGVILWGQTAFAGDDERETPCKKEVLDTGETICVRTRVVSRRVVRRSSRPPTRRTAAKSAAKSAAKPKQGGIRLVVDPSAHEAARASAPAVSTPAPAKKTAVAQRTTTSAPSVARAPRLKSSAAQSGVSQTVEDPTPSDDPRASVRVEAVTDVPILVGAGFLFETRSRFRVRSSLGVLPAGYLKLSNRLIQGVDSEYSEQAQLLVERAVDDTITWRSQIGFRPFQRAGFYVHTGYTLLGIRGNATGAELVGAIDSFDEDQGELVRRMDPSEVAMNSRLHMVDLELGWDFALGERANLRLGAGWAYTLYSKTQVRAEFDESSDMPREEVALFEEVSGKYLDAIYRTYVHPPSLSMAFGVRF